MTWREWTMGLTFVLLTASVVLIVPGVFGVGASGPLLGVILAVAAVLAAVRPTLADLPPVAGQAVGPYVRDIWLGPVVAVALVALVDTGASPGELQAIGGFAGLLGMLNYFVRPLYFFLADLVRRYLPDDRAE